MTNTLLDPSEEFYGYIKDMVGVSIYEDHPEKEASFPCIVYNLTDNTPHYDLSRNIANQTVEFTLDIYAKSPAEVSDLLVTLEGLVREHNYILDYNVPVPDPDGYSHRNVRFKLIS